MADFIVGLTGGIGSGKSAVSTRFENLGVVVADTDVASRDVVAPGQPALDRIAEHFGHHIIASDGNLDRAQLRKAVFDDPDQRRWLERLLNPLIAQHTADQLAAAESAYAVLVNPVLIETGHFRLMHRVLVVDAPAPVRLARTMTRDNNSEAQVRAIMASQADDETRLAAAHDVIVNDGSVDELDRAVEALHAQYQTLSETHRAGNGKRHDNP